MAKKRLGRGYGSGKGGHTCGRGQKGQKSRGKMHVLFEGVKVKKSTLKKIPFLRGKGKFLPRLKPVLIKTNDLAVFNSGDKISIESLIEKGVVDAGNAKSRGVKIVMGKKLDKKLIFEVPTSGSVLSYAK